MASRRLRNKIQHNSHTKVSLPTTNARTPVNIKKTALGIILAMIIAVSAGYTYSYFHLRSFLVSYVKSYPFQWDACAYVGINTEDLDSYIAPKSWEDWEVKGFALHKGTSIGCMENWLEMHYEHENDNKIIVSVKTLLSCQINGTEFFTKRRFCSKKNNYDYEEIKILPQVFE
jgi:hypothetical protein